MHEQQNTIIMDSPAHITGQPLCDLPIYNEEDLMLIICQAVKYQRSHKNSLNQLHWFYRDKSREYFGDVMESEGGVMAPYIKDNHGDPRSPINGRINGLFFTANSTVDQETNQPKTISLFGHRRFLVPAPIMVNTITRIYFADFYCVNSKRRPHYVTLVMTTADSVTDRFCQKHLVLLNPKNNPFLVIKKKSKGKYTVHVRECAKLCTEVLYTNNVNIPHMLRRGASFQDVHCVGRHGGRKPKPKNAQCAVCCLPNSLSGQIEE